MPDAPVLPRTTTGLPPAPVSPVVDAPTPGPAADVVRLLTAFRSLQVQHTRVLHQESAAHGMHPSDARVLFLLAAADGEGVTPKQAAEDLELSTGAMTSLIDRLERRGHIERHPNPLDRRSVIVHLTPAGAAVARTFGEVYAAAFGAAVAPAHRADLADDLLALGTALEQQVRLLRP
jgi:DNA-binding MarR family transcriptional regulator